MDKSLKHLSRLDLLELMVKLSEENDAIAAENAQLKQALAAKPAMSRAAKVGSIAELALQANGFFEAAQHAADDYLREIKRMHDQVAARAGTAGQPPSPAAGGAQAQVPAASPAIPAVSPAMDAAQVRSQAQAVLARANSQAEAIVADARKKAETMLTDASRQSRSIISRANHQADAIMQAACSDARRQAADAAASAVSAHAGAAPGAARPAASSNAAASAAHPAANAAPTSRGRHARTAEGAQ